MGARLAALVMVSALGLEMRGEATIQAEGERTTRRVLAFFEGHSGETIDAFLMRLRPSPLDAASRAQVIASLPNDGEVQPFPKDGEKLPAAQRVLDYSARSGAITIKVIDLDSAFVGLYYRTVVLVSARALALLSADELAALVAHEVGHDDDWDDYWTAMLAHQNERMRELELKADGIGTLTLKHLGIDPERLVSAIQKMMQYYGRQKKAAGATRLAGALSSADRYVSLDERVEFIREIARLPWAAGQRDDHARRLCQDSRFRAGEAADAVRLREPLGYLAEIACERRQRDGERFESYLDAKEPWFDYIEVLDAKHYLICKTAAPPPARPDTAALQTASGSVDPVAMIL